MRNGLVRSLWRYPVKSLLGEQVSCLEMDERGVVADRMFAVANAEGKFGSGKSTQRFRRIDGLLGLSAKVQGDGVLVTFPDGVELTSGSEELNGKLSETLGEEVRLVREAEIPHFDDGSVHLVTAGSLSKLRELLPESGVDERRFRSNLVIEMSPHVTDEYLIGKRLRIGEVLLEVTHKTERCRMVALEQCGLREAPELMKRIAEDSGLCFGIYAAVIETGAIRSGDAVEMAS